MGKMQRFQTFLVLSEFLHSSAHYSDVEAQSSSIPRTQCYSHAFYIIRASCSWLKEVREAWSASA